MSLEEAGGEVWDTKDFDNLPAELPLPQPLDYGGVDTSLPTPANADLWGDRARAKTDIWEDAHTLHFLHTGTIDDTWGKPEETSARQSCVLPLRRWRPRSAPRRRCRAGNYQQQPPPSPPGKGGGARCARAGAAAKPGP